MRDSLDDIIEDARKRGLFDNLPGEGKPLDLFEDSNVPPEVRTMYRMLKNANIAPPEVQELQRIAALEEKLEMITDREKRERIRTEIINRRAGVEARIARMKDGKG